MNGKPWMVACDEPGDAQHSLVTDAEDPPRFNARTNALWGLFLAGGRGSEWYFGYKHPHSDLSCEDFRTRDRMWEQSAHALAFFRGNSIPLGEMACHDALLKGGDGFCLAAPGKIYVVLVKDTSEVVSLDLCEAGGEVVVKRFDPRNVGRWWTGLPGGSPGKGWWRWVNLREKSERTGWPACGGGRGATAPHERPLG